MNSDPHDSAAWRTFGMMDADESAIFDEAMRHDPALRGAFLEMDRLSAAIGAASVAPIEPRAGQLERLQNRLGLYPVKRSYFWMGISGWAAAAALSLLLVFTRGESSKPHATVAANSAARGNGSISPKTAHGKTPSANPESSHTTNEATASNDAADDNAAVLAAAQELAKNNLKVETKRLVQEIEVLRENLEKFQQRDRILFEAVPGVAVPIVMTMRPPGLESDGEITLAQNDTEHSITGMLGDALKLVQSDSHTQAAGTSSGAFAMAMDQSAHTTETTTSRQGLPGALAATASSPLGDDATTNNIATDASSLPPIVSNEAPLPSAVPIYDAARDSGTLVVNNLPSAGDGNVYNLWVHTIDGQTPIYVGSLPESSESGTDSFDFNLGSTRVLPSGFVLTKDEVNKPSTPSVHNTVLQGPTTPGQ
jgi:hypothetical protein